MKKMYPYFLLTFVLAFLVIGCIRDKANIVGTVSDTAGTPLSGASLLAVDASIYFDLNISSSATIAEIQSAVTAAGGSIYTASSGTDGSYRINDIGISAYLVTASHNNIIGTQAATLLGGIIGCSSADVTCNVIVQ